MKSINRSRLQFLMQREQKKFVDERPKSKALFERASKSLLAGVPMNWMMKWAGAFPPFVREAQGAHFYDVDGHRYIVEMSALGFPHKRWKGSGPFHHPVHGHAGQQGLAGTFEKRFRLRALIDK